MYDGDSMEGKFVAMVRYLNLKVGGGGGASIFTVCFLNGDCTISTAV